jgi:hypothetical protein
MKQLGSTVDDFLGDDQDDKPAGGGRRGSKQEKKCTPLKEKLHKSWGGRVSVRCLNCCRPDLDLRA